jgi:hypothetical protein
VKRTIITIAICLILVVNVANGQGWRLVASYSIPQQNPRGIQVAGIWAGYIVEAASPPYVYLVVLRTGSVVSSFAVPGGDGAWGITAYSSSAIYISNNRTSWIYKVTSTGSLISSFQCPVVRPADMNLNWLTGYLDIAIPDMNVIAVVTTSGSLVQTFKAPGSRPTACCGYQSTLIADSATHTVYEDGVPVITGIETPVGADEEASTDNDYTVWVLVVDDATDRVYLYEKAMEVVPGSLGRVKALFQ